ncbi:glycosyltransferase [Nocardioides sp. STR2]|uniref:Glycosyltransferase n=1 Tax=Nocardioides pini TaxID=2975053 RepID=A0ABT4CDC9_9ACTN|nr:glycosyltransferase [Nocardioides pini]MCY4726968.1 glycosyltransferase [Nocardioides pini]
MSSAPTRVYYATDAYDAGADLLGRDPGWLRELERRRLVEATHVGAVSSVITDGWQVDRPTFVLPNGANTRHYVGVDDAPLPDDVQAQGPVVGVVGHLSARIDLDVLEAVAARPITLLLVGPRVEQWGGQRFEELVQRPNVVWVGNKAYAELPSYLRVMDVGLTPYVTSAFNQASSPLKTLEYLAAGRAALSTPLPGVTALDTELVECASTPHAFAVAAERLARRDRDDALVRARRELAYTHDWDSRARQLLEIIGLPARGEVTTGSR